MAENGEYRIYHSSSIKKFVAERNSNWFSKTCDWLLIADLSKEIQVRWDFDEFDVRNM